jgi:quercetin dioxygenase-like cupin family protein
MLIITETSERTTTTAAATMSALATPSAGSRELATWRVRMPAESTGPLHAIDREQIWMPLAGVFEITTDGETRTLAPGQAGILPAGVERLIRTLGAPAEALVAMPAGGRALVPGQDAPVPLPWAA